MSNVGTLNMAGASADAVSDALSGPRGPRPRPRFSRRNIFLYGTLIVVALYYLLPLYVMIVTSLKGMPEIRLGNIFSPPVEITFQPWVKAWAEACTGLNCEGLSRGFWNSVQILIPSVVLSIVIGIALFAEYPTAATLVGSAIVVASGIFIIYREHRLGLERGKARPVTPPHG